MRYSPALLLLAACATSTPSSRSVEELAISKGRSRTVIAKASITGTGQDIPKERNGIRLEDTGAIMWVCANSDKHADQECFFETCAPCGRANYFFFDHSGSQYVCYACLATVDPATVKCKDCGEPPKRWRTKPKLNKE